MGGGLDGPSDELEGRLQAQERVAMPSMPVDRATLESLATDLHQANHARVALAGSRVRAQEEAGIDIDRFALAMRRQTGKVGALSDEDLVRELRSSGLVETDAIIGKLKSSAEEFSQRPLNLNSLLADARIALETLAKAVAHGVPSAEPFAGQDWGAGLAHLRKEGYITERREKGLAGVYTFISDGSHVALGMSELEMAALGRRLVVSMCYFLVRLYKGTRGSKAG